MQKTKPRKRSLKALPLAEASWTVDPLSDLVSASELAVWKRDPTTAKLLRFLSRWRSQMVDGPNGLAEGASLSERADTSAMKTTEYVAKAQILRDILTLEGKDIAEFYGLDEVKDPPK